jgi:hypothetical protein
MGSSGPRPRENSRARSRACRSGRAHAGPIAAIWSNRAYGYDGRQRGCSTHKPSGRSQGHPSRARLQQSASGLPSRPRCLDRPYAAPAELLPHHECRKDLARLASKAIQAGQLGLALRLEKAGDDLSDELDQEEEINDAARMTYDVYPCPRAASAYTARADMLRLVERAVPICRSKAHTLRVSFAARRTFMQQCLRPY